MSNTTEVIQKNGLTSSEMAERNHLEGVIDSVINGINQLAQIGDASLKVLRDKRLYRSTHKTFEDYCQDRFGITRRYANNRIVFASILEDLGTRVPKLPETEYQARPLAKLDTPEQQAEAWQNAQKASGEEQPSSAKVNQSVDDLLAKLKAAETRANDAETNLGEAKKERDLAWEREQKADAKWRQYREDLLEASKREKAIRDEMNAKLKAKQQELKDADEVHRESLAEMREQIAAEERKRPRTDAEQAEHERKLKDLKDAAASIQTQINQAAKEREKLQGELNDTRKELAFRDEVLSDFSKAASRFRETCLLMSGAASALKQTPVTDELYQQLEMIREMAQSVIDETRTITSVK